MKSLAAHFLVASPHLRDPNFAKTVVLLVQHSNEGSLGLVLNRPTTKALREVMTEAGEPPCEVDLCIRLGGPVPGPMMALHTDETLADLEVLPDLFVAAQKQNLLELMRGDRGPFLVFLGNSGWGPGQLENELELGGWFTAPATVGQVFHSGDNLWKVLCSQIGRDALQSMLHLHDMPRDPSMN